MSKKPKWKQAAVSRDAGGFVAMPWAVLDSPAYQDLSHPAKGLLMEFARQYIRDNNGMLLASTAYLKARGWKSCSVIDRAKKELIEAGFIYETAKGQRPSKASWYAVTWAALDHIDGFDPGARHGFQRSAYRTKTALLPTKPQPKSLMKKSANSVTDGYGLSPLEGTQPPSTVPLGGIESAATVPLEGTVKGGFCDSSIPLGGNHLEVPSAPDQRDGASAHSAAPKIADAPPTAGVDGHGSYQRLRAKPERLFTGLPGLGAFAPPAPAPAPQREDDYRRLTPKPRRLFSKLLSPHHEQAAQIVLQRAMPATREAVAP
ncbi:MAG: helix-turn-helix domain-containing protein [Burkholderiaceae bacterium]|nr:helix-turn-helix domain-containing protein [Burkholderiaceae bacterium]